MGCAPLRFLKYTLLIKKKKKKKKQKWSLQGHQNKTKIENKGRTPEKTQKTKKSLH
jgi:hypothetical protein